MVVAALLALSLSNGAPLPASKLDQLAQPAAETNADQAPAKVSVVLDCQVAAKSLTDCKAVNEVADASVVAEAIRMAGVVALPAALADSGVRIRIKMNVAP